MQSENSPSSSDSDTINLSEIEDAILFVLPKIGAVKLAQLVETLIDPQMVGVVSTEDLQFVLESDISHILTAVEVRKLICNWRNTGVKIVTETTMGKKQIQSSASSSPSSSSESSVDQEIAFDRIQTWDIPWHKMPQQLTESLTRKKRPTPRLREEMITIIIDHFHKGPSSLPRKKQLRILAQKIVAEHPKSFKDDVGSGYDSLLAQLVNRANNLSRLPGSHPFKRASQSNDSTPPKKRKTDSYGCISWQPDTFPAGETEKTQQQKNGGLANTPQIWSARLSSWKRGHISLRRPTCSIISVH